jgi:hypothetical protein
MDGDLDLWRSQILDEPGTASHPRQAALLPFLGEDRPLPASSLHGREGQQQEFDERIELHHRHLEVLHYQHRYSSVG